MPETYNYNQNSGQQPMYNPPQYQPQAGMEPPPGYVQKSRVAAGILAILLGTYGIHSFYLGNTSRGLLQLLLSLFTCGIGAIVMFIWGIVDGVRILDGRINTDAREPRTRKSPKSPSPRQRSPSRPLPRRRPPRPTPMPARCPI